MASPDWHSADNKASLLDLPRELRRNIQSPLSGSNHHNLPPDCCSETGRTPNSRQHLRNMPCFLSGSLFYQLAISEVATSECWDYMTQTMAFSSNDNWLPLVQNVFVSVENTNGHDLKDLLGIFPGITTLTIDIQSIGFMLGSSFLRTMNGMERLLISQSTLILGSAATDEGKWPDYDLLRANEDWARCLVIQRARTSSAFSFKLFLRIDFKYNLDYPFVDDDVWVRNSHLVVIKSWGSN